MAARLWLAAFSAGWMGD